MPPYDAILYVRYASIVLNHLKTDNWQPEKSRHEESKYHHDNYLYYNYDNMNSFINVCTVY